MQVTVNWSLAKCALSFGLHHWFRSNFSILLLQSVLKSMFKTFVVKIVSKMNAPAKNGHLSISVISLRFRLHLIFTVSFIKHLCTYYTCTKVVLISFVQLEIWLRIVYDLMCFRFHLSIHLSSCSTNEHDLLDENGAPWVLVDASSPAYQSAVYR